MKKLIELRGHHINMLAQYKYKYDFKEGKADYDIIVITPTPSNNGRLNSRSVNDYVAFFGYSELMNKKIDLLLNFITTNPNTKVKIVEGLDSICYSCSKRLSDPEEYRFCAVKQNIWDEKNLNAYNLAPNQIYTSAELIEKIKKFQEKTGFVSYQMYTVSIIIRSIKDRQSEGKLPQVLN